ncbi:MAG: hypothetical protein ACLQM8_13670 [Limisphaerales bacterium]
MKTTTTATSITTSATASTTATSTRTAIAAATGHSDAAGQAQNDSHLTTPGILKPPRVGSEEPEVTPQFRTHEDALRLAENESGPGGHLGLAHQHDLAHLRQVGHVRRVGPRACGGGGDGLSGP